jgi:patatin-like phospholipase
MPLLAAGVGIVVMHSYFVVGSAAICFPSCARRQPRRRAFITADVLTQRAVLPAIASISLATAGTRLPQKPRHSSFAVRQICYDASMFDAIVFAGGGNRCYWQGGFYEAVAERLGLAPKLVVGASAGAFAATYSLLGNGPEVRKSVIGACGPHLKNFDFAAWRQGKPLCPVGPMYVDLLAQTIDAAALARLNTLTDFRIAVARLPRGLSPAIGAAIGIGVYQIEKHLFHPVHPRFGRALGFRGEFVAVRSLSDPQQMRDAMIASSGVPPFMPVTLVGNTPAFDGGLVDNVPVEPLTAIETAGGRTLVLLTRIYKALPSIPNRTYVQPSQKINVSQFDITNPGGIRAAFELGQKDGDAFARSVRR